MRSERLGVMLALLLSLAAAAAEPPPYLGRPLGEVRFVCDEPIDEAGLRSLIGLEAGAPLTQEKLDEARRLVDLTEIFESVDLAVEPADPNVDVVVRLGRKRVVGNVRFVGLDGLSEKDALRVVRLDKGVIYEPDLVDGARERLVERYQRLAYVDATVRSSTQVDGGEIDVEFDVAEGLPETIAAVIADGDLEAWDEDLQKQAKRIEGGPHVRKAVRNAERRLVRKLRDKGYYETRLRFDFERFGSNRGVLRIHVDSGPRFVLAVTGNEAKDQDDLLELIDLEERLIVTDGTWRQLATRMREEYQRDGFYDVRIEVDIGSGDPKTVTFRVEEGRRYVVRRIEFEGNEKIPTADLLAQMETARRQWIPWPRPRRLVSTVLNEDMKRLRRLYRQRGFASAVVSKTRRRVDPEHGTIDIAIPIDEGPQTLVREVDDTAVPASVNRKTLRLRAGVPYDPTAIEPDRRTIEDALRRDGYPEPRVEAATELGTRHDDAIDAIVRWRVDAGGRERVGRIIVQRNVDTRSEAIVRELKFAPGDPLSVDHLLEAQVNVYKLGLFRAVSISPIGPPGAVRDVAVTVTEKPAGNLTLAGGYNTRDGIKALVELGYDNVGGMARRVSLRVEGSLDPDTFVPDQYLAGIAFIEPRLLDSTWRYKVNAIAERSTENVDKYSLERLALFQSVDSKLWKAVQGGLELQIEQSRVFDVQDDVAVIPEDEGNLRTISLSPFLAFDGRDDPFLPTRGLFDSWAWRYALPVLSDVHFAKFTTQHTQWVPLGGDVTLVYAARLGIGQVISGAPILPIRERFFLGGRTTVRGFKENSIGPLGENGHELGGDLSVNLNLELIFPLLYGFQLATFVDGGGLYLIQCDSDCREERGITDATVTFENFRRSAGLGLRYKTPVGPLALDYGIKLDRRDGEGFGRLHFNIGTTF